jgi:predicted TIM-barrel fold metal-dependent hydrolase
MSSRRQFLKTAIAGGAAAVLTPSALSAASQAPYAPAQASAGWPAPGSPILEDGVAPAHTIDWHNHWMSARVVDLLRKHDADHPDAANGYAAGIAGSGLPAPAAPGPGSNFTISIDRRIEHLQKTGVERQVISWPTTLGWDAVLSPGEARTIWTAFNDDLAALVREHPAHCSGYSIVPTSDVEWAAGEAERGFRDLGLIGVTLPVGGFQTLEGAKRLSPILEVIQRHKGILYLHTGPAHPTIPGQRISDASPDRSSTGRGRLAAPATFARGAVTLTQTGYLDPYPDVTVQIAMLGGLTSFLFALSHLNTTADGAPDPIERLRRVYLDASTARVAHTLELAVATIGADRILFGTDYGAGPRIDPIVAAVHGAALTEREKALIFVENGRRLFAATGRA